MGRFVESDSPSIISSIKPLSRFFRSIKPESNPRDKSRATAAKCARPDNFDSRLIVSLVGARELRGGDTRVVEEAVDTETSFK